MSAPNKEFSFKYFLISFLSIWTVVFLLIINRFVIYSFDGNVTSHLLKNMRTIVSLMQDQKEIPSVLYGIGSFFLLVNFAPRRAIKIIYPVFIFIVFLFVFYRTLDAVHVYYAGRHIEKDFVTHIERSSLGLLLNVRTIFILLVPVILTTVINVALRKLDYSAFTLKARLIAFLLLIALSYSVIYAIKMDKNTLQVTKWMDELYFKSPAAASSPERSLLASFVFKPAVAMQDSLTPAIKRKMEAFGVNINPSEKYSLYKNWVFKGKLPYPKTDNKTNTPNVIIFAMESLSARFLGFYGSPYKDISPNIDHMAERSLVVRPFFNSSVPTINGLVSILCSSYPVNGHEEWNQKGAKMQFHLLCMPEVLKKRGYISYNFTAGNPYFAGQLPFFEANGMDKVTGAVEIENLLHEKPEGDWGYSDHQVVRFLNETLKTSAFKEPFSITLSTTDLHAPFKLPIDYKKYSGANSPILDLVHSTDDAFGMFWKYFENSPYANNTIVILTADHAIVPGVEYKDLMIKEKEIGYYDEVPLIIYDPTHRLPHSLNVSSSSVDILPSLLQLLDLNVGNPFEGLSVFGENNRALFPNLLGSTEYLFFYRLNGRNVSFARSDVEYECSSSKLNGKDSDDTNFNRCDFWSWWKYKRWLAENNLIWAPDPAISKN